MKGLTSVSDRTGENDEQDDPSSSPIPLADLRAQYVSIQGEINAAIHRVMCNAKSVRGQELEYFENDFAGHYRTPIAIGVSSGMEALQLALLACRVEPNDEVITTSLGPREVVEAICGIGAVPVFIDIDENTWNLDPADIESVVTQRTKAILPVHLHGRPADMARILATAHRFGVNVVESASHAQKARHHGRLAGTLGDIGCFSCGPDEPLGAYGSAGVVITNDEALGASVKRLRDQGQRRRYGHLRARPSSRLDPLQAAVLRVKLRHLDCWNSLRRELADLYRDELTATPVRLPAAEGPLTHSYGVFAVRTLHRDALRQTLHANRIASAVHYQLPLHLAPPCRYLNYAAGDFPRTEEAARELLSLPIYPEMDQRHVARVAAVLKESFAVSY